MHVVALELLLSCDEQNVRGKAAGTSGFATSVVRTLRCTCMVTRTGGHVHQAKVGFADHTTEGAPDWSIDQVYYNRMTSVHEICAKTQRAPGTV